MNESTEIFHKMIIYKFIFGIEQNEKATCATYLKSLVNLFATILWLPLRVKWIRNNKERIHNSSTNDNNNYESRKPHRISIAVQIFVYIGVVINSWYSVYQFIDLFQSSASNGGAAFILSVLADFCQLAILTLTWKLFWIRPEVFVSLLNTLGQYETNQTKNWKLKISFAVTFLVIINFVMGIASPHQRADTSGIATLVVNKTANILGYLSCNENVKENSCNFLYTLGISWSFWSHRAGSLNEYFTIVVAYTIYMVGVQFVKIIRAAKTIDELMHNLRKLRVLNEQVNSVVGNNYFLLFVSTLTYYASTPAYLSNRESLTFIYQYWYKLVYIVIHSLIWIYTSEFHRMIQVELRRWISEKKYESGLTAVEIGKLNLLAVETEHDPVGVSCRYFTVNYQLISSLIGLLITYSIIAVQVQWS